MSERTIHNSVVIKNLDGSSQTVLISNISDLELKEEIQTIVDNPRLNVKGAIVKLVIP
jgi:hypothetical protein